MIFFVGMGVMFGIINLVLPLQIGARDVAFPFLNNLSFWLFASGGMFILVSLVVGVYAGTGWSAYPPLAGIKYNPGVGVDYWLWSVQISGAGSLAFGDQFLSDDLEDALSWDDSDENAHLCLGHFSDDDSRRFCFSHLDCNRCHAHYRSPSRYPYLYCGVWRQSDDVYQLVLGMGASGSLYSRLACFWDLFRSGSRLFSKKTVWLYLDGMGACCDHLSLLYRLAAPLLYDGSRSQCQCILWHHDDDHRYSHGGQNL